MDKRRSEGSSRERSRTNTIAPKRIANSDAFLDASRDPRLNNDKYRAQMMSNKSRVSPDTTITTMASKNGPSKVDKVDKADLNQGGLGQTSQISVNKNACFACAMCPNRLFDAIDKVRGHVEDEHSISVKEIVDKLIKLPATNYLRSFRCVACPASASSSIGTSEEELKVHFKEKHKINTVKPFLIKRICRICDYDKSTSNDQLVKHITDEHPRSDYGDEDEDDQDEANEEASNNDEYEPYEPEEELDYEPKPESPAPVVSRDRSRDQRDYEASSVPEDGELSAEESRRRSRKRSRSVSSNSSQSSHESKIKVKPRKYRDSSSSSADSRLGRRKKASSVSPETKRKVYIKGSTGSKVVERKKPQSPARVAPTSSTSGTAGKEVFGLYYTPPGGFCEECNERYDKGEGAQRHYKSKAHFFNTKNKYRCYFCNAYVQDTKGHLESRHRDMTFQCQLNGCNHPRFTQAAKVIDHVRCNHSREFKRTNKDMDLFRKKMISMPRNIMSFTCKQCRIVFHGDVKIAIVHLVLEHGQNVPQRNDFVFQCRICGPRALFDNERQLESHCKMHLDEVSRGASRSPSSDRSSVDRGRSRSRSRSRSYSPRFQGGGGRPEGGRPGSGDRESGGNRGGAKSILRCHFCTDEFRTLAVRKNHMLRDHRELLFECALCTFANMYRRDLVWHLREHHRKEHGFSDGQLVKEFVHMPKDLRKIICIKCSETEAHENAVWLAVDPNEITKDLKYHAHERHGVSGKEVDSIYRLMCMGCNEKFELDGEIKEWDDHMERQPCRQNGPRERERSRSRSRSRTPFDDGFRGDRGAASGPPRRASSPVHIDLDQHCVFCSKAEMETKSIMENHVRQRHLEMAFICRLCETGNIHYEPDLPSIKDHLKEDHSKDDLDNEDVKDYTRYPRSLMCIKCNLCGLLCHGQKEDDLELHFKVYHEEVDFSTQHLDFLCRICMISGQNDSQHELKEHLYNSHPDEMK